MARRVSWTNNSSGHLGTYVYRAPTLDPQALPDPVATVDPVAQGATAEWIDNEELAAGDYDYAVQDFDGQGDSDLSAIEAHAVVVTGGARYWRVYITKTRDSGTYRAMLAEVEFRASVGGANQATGGTAIGSTSPSIAGSDYSFSSAFDDDSSTAWLSGQNEPLPQWVGYDFGASVVVEEVLLQAADSSARAARAPEDFSIEHSDDGVSWTSLASFVAEPAWGISEARTYEVAV